MDPAPAYAGGDGSQASPYLISSVRQLKKLSVDISIMGSVDVTYGKYFELTTDLDFAGDNITASLISSFYGTFDGKNHLIKNLTINSAAGGATIIGNLYFGELKNLGRVGGATITTANNGAGFISVAYNCKLSNCFNTANITSNTNTGGLIGVITPYNASVAGTIPTIIENCYNTGNVTSTTGGAGGFSGTVLFQGGILIVKNSYNSGNIKTDAIGGGLLGSISSGQGIEQTIDFTNLFNFGNVVITLNNNRIGAIIGTYAGTTNPADVPFTFTVNNVISRPDVAKKNTSVLVNYVIGYNNAAQQTWVQSVISANPTLKEDAKYTLDYSKSAAFATELGSGFKYANDRTPKLAWEK
jgi:hypothetical protein